MTDWTAKVRAGLGKIPASGPDATVAAGLAAADAAARDWLLWRAGPVLRARIESANTSQLPPSQPSEPPPSGRGVWDDWTLASAMESTRSLKSNLEPAFLWFELAAESDPVAGADSAENLADASRLVSWLMGQILFELTSRLGPEAVIYPGLRGQPLVDWFHRGTLQRSTFAVPGRPAQSVWQALGLSEDRVFQQVSDAWLPPHFVALVPADFEMASLLEVVATARDRSPWRRLTDACWSYLSSRGAVSPQQRRSWDFQISHGWRVSWQIWPWQSEADLRGNVPPLKDSALRPTTNVAEQTCVAARRTR